MLKISNFEVLGWEHAIRGMRNPMNSWEKSDSCTQGYVWCNEIMQQLHVNTSPFSAFVKTEKGMSIFKNSYSIHLFIKGHVFFARQKRDKRKELVIRALIYQFTNSIFVHDSFRKISSNPNMTATYQCNKRKHAYLILHRIQ